MSFLIVFCEPLDIGFKGQIFLILELCKVSFLKKIKIVVFNDDASYKV
jgi:hypothetical protein